ncbi:MAG: hypothetical protein K9N48_06715 [Verrucomicrobia bacterium]|nr:hypothetical protein [Verrucomicrobiota bacterium]MCF7709401.1 hypothetical protein [Verrucomicrobiota bacterium]
MMIKSQDNQKPLALLAVSQPTTSAAIQRTLEELEFDVHQATNHEDFTYKFSRYQHSLVIIEETFQKLPTGVNKSLEFINALPGVQRRHTCIILISRIPASLNSTEAFLRSVHAIINEKDLQNIKSILTQIINEYSNMMNPFFAAWEKVMESY